MEPNGLTIITNIAPGQAPALRSLLKEIGGPLGTSPSIDFRNMSSVHYAAFLILPDLGDRPPRLLLETNYDGGLNAHLNELIRRGAPALDKIYELCEGYPPSGFTQDPEGVRQYFLKNSVPTSAFFIAFPGRTLADIRNAIAVHQEAKRYLNECTPKSGSDRRSQDQVWDDLVEHFRLRSPVQPVRSPITRQWLCARVAFNALAVLAVPAVLVLLFGWRYTLAAGVLVVLLLLVLILITRIYEISEAKDRNTRYDATAHPEEYEGLNVGPQNHLCTFATVRASRFRKFMVKTVLFLVEIASRRHFIFGYLGSIATIHFARWILIDNDRRLLFFGNYDGSWTNYLGDFSDQGFGINAIWSNVEGFPATRWLVKGGAYDLEPFEDNVVQHFQSAPIFYSAYPEYPVSNIRRFLKSRDKLARAIVVAGRMRQ